MANQNTRRDHPPRERPAAEPSRAPRYLVNNAHLSWPKDPAVVARLRRGDSVPVEDYGPFVHAYRGEVRDDLVPSSVPGLLAQGSIAPTKAALKAYDRAAGDGGDGEREDPALTHAAAVWALTNGCGDELPGEAEAAEPAPVAEPEPVSEEATDGE